jgi:hypothetical protein
MSSDKLILVCSTSWLAWLLCLQKSFSCVSNWIDVCQFSLGILHVIFETAMEYMFSVLCEKLEGHYGQMCIW